MGSFFAWFRDNWFSFLQSAGIVGGLLFTAISIRQATRARRVSDLLTLTQQHRELWNEVYRRPELSRIYESDVDLVAKPVTMAEERFLNEVAVHFATGWQMVRWKSLVTMDAFKDDVTNFFKLPIPRFVWERTKHGRDARFVRFVDSCLNRKKRDSNLV